MEDKLSNWKAYCLLVQEEVQKLFKNFILDLSNGGFRYALLPDGAPSENFGIPNKVGEWVELVQENATPEEIFEKIKNKIFSTKQPSHHTLNFRKEVQVIPSDEGTGRWIVYAYGVWN